VSHTGAEVFKMLGIDLADSIIVEKILIKALKRYSKFTRRICLRSLWQKSYMPCRPKSRKDWWEIIKLLTHSASQEATSKNMEKEKPQEE